jgi:hypothetical protein
MIARVLFSLPVLDDTAERRAMEQWKVKGGE